MTIPNQRHLFDIPDGLSYLNCAQQSPLLNAVCRAGETGASLKAHPWTDFRTQAAADAETARGLFGRLIGATENDIAIVPATSYGVAIAAANLPVTHGQKIVVTQDQFPSDYYAWRHLAEQSGGELVTVNRPKDGDWTSALESAINANTAIVSAPPCHWTDGGAVNLNAIGARCHEVGSAFVIDATQAAGAMPLDVTALQPDFLVSSAYKWLLCPYTLGFLYAAPHRQSGQPIEWHEWAVSAMEGTSGARGARRYDMGERNNPINLKMALAALEQLLDWGTKDIAATVKQLTDKIAAGAAERGFSVPPAAHRVNHIIGLRRTEGWPPDIIERLAADNVYVSQRSDSLRVSPHVFNDTGDIDRLLAAVDRCL